MQWMRLATLTSAALIAGSGCRSQSDISPSQNPRPDPGTVISVETEGAALSGPANLSVSSSFNASPIAQGSSIWFTATIVPTGVPATHVSHLYLVNQTITFTANGTAYNLAVPDGTLVYDPNVTTPATQFVASTQSWLTSVPASYTGSAFIAGLSWTAPANLPGNISPVTWNGTVTTDDAGMGVTFSWGAAVYQPFPSASCTPKTCAQAGVRCGTAPDGCGGTLSCGTCSAPPPSCTGLCTRQVACNPGTTSISGTVFAPTDPLSAYGPQVDPIPHATVYVPNGTVAPFTSGPSCDLQCGAPVSGNPLVLTQASWDGTFRLQNVPAGANVPLVIQSGKWRRQITIPYVTPCQDNPLPSTLTRLPRTHQEGDIPMIAMVTGNVDTLECVLLKMGIAQSEFTTPSGSGRVHLYVANGETLAGAPSETQLFKSGGTINNYDYVLFACEGHEYDEQPADQQRVINYANLGGRVLATHYSYTWLYDAAPFSSTGSWDINQYPPCNVNNGNCTNTLTANVDMSFPKGAEFAHWLHLTHSDNGTEGQVAIEQPRHDLDAVNPSYGQQWIYSAAYSSVQHYSFVTPVGSTGANQCGRVIYSDFHVNNLNPGYAQTFPAACTSLPMSGNDRIMEYMLFDLGACIQSDTGQPAPPSACSPAYACNGACGLIPDGCGGHLDCGSCTPPNAYASLSIKATAGSVPAGTPTNYEGSLRAGGTGNGGSNYTGSQMSSSVGVPSQSGCANVVCQAADQCHTAGTCDPTTGMCSAATTKVNGTPCNDGNACTQTDTCQSGVCVGSNPVACTPSDQCHLGGTCNPTSGVCSNPAAPNNTACSTGNPCTHGDSCQSGVCVGGTVMACPSPDGCHAPGVCQNFNGSAVCTFTANADGSACNDGNACTSGDVCAADVPNGGSLQPGKSQVCHNGHTITIDNSAIPAHLAIGDFVGKCSICSGTAYSCTSADQCHQAGTCNGDGTCSFAAKPNGTACNDGVACTGNDTCTNGTCAGAPYTCAPPDQCHQAGTCNGDGTCSYVPLANRTACNDGNACTNHDVCTAGVCAGTPYSCAAPDQCHNAGTCNGDGTCAYANKPNSTACNDGNTCTHNDQCIGGVCSGVAFTCPPPDQCHQAGTCNEDGTCSYVPVANGTACNDGNACTSHDVCSAGVCAGTHYSCASPDQCHQAGSCNGDGTCSFANKPNNTSCNDGNACTSGDVCTNGVCAGTSYSCSSPDQCHSAGTCNGDGTCSFANKPNGTACSANCSPQDTCSNGVCGGTCAAPDQCHQAGTCTQGGGCAYQPKADGTSCNDNNLSTANDVCTAGVCAGTPIVCAAPDQCHQAGVPNGTNCTYAPKADGTSCSDGNLCTQGDQCTAGVCAGSPVVCSASDQCHTAGTCNPSTGVCSNPNAPNGTSCSDNNACTTSDVCTNGTCAGSPVVCTASDQCHTAGTCNPSTGACSNPSAADGTTCNDGDACTNNDTCTAGACAGKPVHCAAADSCHVAGTCDRSTGLCSNPSAPDGTSCSDGNLCFTGDMCRSGACQRGTPVLCTASDQCHSAGACNPSTGACSNPAAANGTACSDGNACTQGDMCINGACQSGSPVVCTASDQCHGAGACDPSSGVCSNPLAPDGTACDDGNACSLTDSCRTGACVGTSFVTCMAPDTCHDPGVCIPSSGACSAPTAKPNGSPCQDGNPCTLGDSCTSGVCQPGQPVICTASDQCHAAGVCDPASGQCSNPTQPDGTACDDANACTQNDVCTGGTCTGQNPVMCPAPSNQCEVAGSCDPTSGVCGAVSTAPDGTPCNDGNACTVNDSCGAGRCAGSPVVCPVVNGVAGTCNPITGICFYDN